MTQALQDLTSTDDAKVKKALKHAREKGDKRFILPLLTAFAARPEDGLREEMQDLLGSLKISAAEDVFLDALGDAAFQHIAADVLAFLWSCGFTCESRLSLVTEVACAGDYRQAMEGTTLLEQVESVTDEKDVLEAQVLAGQALGDAEKKSIRPFVEAMMSHLSMLNDSLS